MTQIAINAPVPATLSAEPIIADAGEPTMEQLAALLPEPEASAEQTRAVVEAQAPKTEEAAAEEPEVTTKPEAPAEVDAALERAEKAAAAARAGSKRYAETQRQLQAQQAEVQRAAREAAQLRQENAAAREREADLQRDPYKTLKDRGMTDADLATRALRENTPEAITQKLQERIEASEARAAALEQRLNDERAEAQRVATRARVQAEYQAAAKDPSLLALALYKPGGQLTAAREALARISANGFDTSQLSPAQVAEAANEYIRQEWLSDEQLKTLAGPRTPVAAKAPVAKTSGKTLTNAQAATKTVAPAEWDTLTDEQQFAHMAAALGEPHG